MRDGETTGDGLPDDECDAGLPTFDLGQVAVETAVAVVPGAGQGRRILTAIFGDPNAGWQSAVALGLQEDLGKLAKRMSQVEDEVRAQGKSVDELSAHVRMRWHLAFAEAVTEADGKTKRELLLEVAAHQTDPRLGSRAQRRHLWERVCEMEDLELDVMLALSNSEQGRLFIDHHSRLFQIVADDLALFREDGVDADTAVWVLRRLAVRFPGLVAENQHPHRFGSVSYKYIARLTGPGKAFMKKVCELLDEH